MIPSATLRAGFGHPKLWGIRAGAAAGMGHPDWGGVAYSGCKQWAGISGDRRGSMRGFKIAINMAWAISAGAYTAGVVDFMTEALDAWYRAKVEGAEVPQHEVTIEGFSGASAGGLCAALSAVLLQDEFEHVADATRSEEHTSELPVT